VGLSPELQRALEPLLAGIESLSERIRECNEGIERLAQESYPQVALLKQVKGVGTPITLTFLLTLEDAHRFGKSRDVGCYLGLQPGRTETFLVQFAHHSLNYSSCRSFWELICISVKHHRENQQPTIHLSQL
jgi:hypothetical protein